MALLGAKFQPPKLFPQSVYGTGRPHNGLCLKFLVLFLFFFGHVIVSQMILSYKAVTEFLFMMCVCVCVCCFIMQSTTMH